MTGRLTMVVLACCCVAAPARAQNATGFAPGGPVAGSSGSFSGTVSAGGVDGGSLQTAGPNILGGETSLQGTLTARDAGFDHLTVNGDLTVVLDREVCLEAACGKHIKGTNDQVHLFGDSNDNIVTNRPLSVQATGVNYMQLAGGGSGNPATITAFGETDVDIDVVPKGSGSLEVKSREVVVRSGTAAAAIKICPLEVTLSGGLPGGGLHRLGLRGLRRRAGLRLRRQLQHHRDELLRHQPDHHRVPGQRHHDRHLRLPLLGTTVMIKMLSLLLLFSAAACTLACATPAARLAEVNARLLELGLPPVAGHVALAASGEELVLPVAAAAARKPSPPPTTQSATARVAEASIQSIEDLGSGQNPRYRWTWRIHVLGAGGTCGPDEQADVPVLTNSATALPGTLTRCAAYADYVDEDLSCAANTVGLLGCDLITYAITSPL